MRESRVPARWRREQTNQGATMKSEKLTAGEKALEKARQIQASGQVRRYEGVGKDARKAKQATRRAERGRIVVQTYSGDRELERGIARMAKKGYRVQAQSTTKRGWTLTTGMIGAGRRRHTVTFERVDNS